MVRETFDFSNVITILPKLVKALPMTLYISVATMAAGMLVGLLLTFGKISRNRIVGRVVSGLTTVLRGIPTVVLLYIVHFGLPGAVKAVSGVDISGWQKQTFVIIALAIELSVTCSEMFRSAYNSLDKGQLEAAHALGMTRIQRFFRVILPQGLYVILPNLTSATLAMIQGTSLAYTLGVMDVMGRARVLDTNAFNMKTLESYFVVALIYWAVSIAVGGVFHLLELRLQRGQKTLSTSVETKGGAAL